MKIVFDLEVMPNFFSCAATQADGPLWFYFEISDWRNDSADLYNWLLTIPTRMIGFNSMAFDGPIIHRFMQMHGRMTAYDLYLFANKIITERDDDRFANSVKPSDREHEWLDLFKIWHYDNKARMTSLKAIEFAMRMDSVEDLPVAPGTVLTQQQAAGMRSYNENDVRATKMFFERSTEKIQLREELSASYGRDFLNYSDVKIGTTIFEIELEKAKIQLYDYDEGGRSPRRTLHPKGIALTNCIPKWVKFDNPAFARVLDYLRAQVVTETKGVFENLTTHAGGLEFVFGTGGLHGSIEGAKVVARENMVIKSKDVSSYYPNLAIHHKFYPEHLTPVFCDIYEKLYETRKHYPKGSAFNAAYKLALNGTFGVSNSPFSVFYDPRFMLSITLSGQMMLCMLIEKIIEVPTARIIMANTDGIEYTIHPDYVEQADEVCRQWEKLTQLELEGVDYRQMFIANVNNYVAQKVNGEVKQKGAFLTQRDYHQNASALVVPKVAEKVLLEGADIEQTVRSWPDKMDFMCRVKINRGSHLRGVKDGNDYVLPNMTRYYVSEGGYALIKLMPPLAKKPSEWRRIGVESGWTVCPCNDITHAVLPIDFNYYIDEVKKLVDPLKEI